MLYLKAHWCHLDLSVLCSLHWIGAPLIIPPPHRHTPTQPQSADDVDDDGQGNHTEQMLLRRDDSFLSLPQVPETKEEATLLLGWEERRGNRGFLPTSFGRYFQKHPLVALHKRCREHMVLIAKLKSPTPPDRVPFSAMFNFTFAFTLLSVQSYSR